jgi:hypothetical protein
VIARPKQKKALWTQAFPKQATPPKVKKRKNYSQSKKRRHESKIYAQMRLEFLEQNKVCQRIGCGRPATCVHHWAGRGKNYLVREFFRASCFSCNQFAKDCPAFARDEDWLAPKNIYCTG